MQEPEIKPASVVVDAKMLLEELAFVQSVAMGKTAMQALQSVLLTSSKTALTVTCTDLDIANRAHIEAVVQLAPMWIAVQPGPLIAILRSIVKKYGPDVSVTIKSDRGTNGNMLTVGHETSSSSLRAMHGSEFPSQAPMRSNPFAIVDSAALFSMLRDVKCGFTAEPARFTLDGALMVCHGKNLEIVSTNGHLLALRNAPVLKKLTTKKKIRFFVRSKAVQQILRLGSGEIDISIEEGEKGSDGFLRFSIGHREVVVRLREVSFPDYREVIAQDLDLSPIVKREAMLAAFERVEVTANKRTFATKLVFMNGSVVVETESDGGSSKETVPIEYEGTELTIGANLKYLNEVFKVMPSSEVAIKMKDSNAQMHVKPVGSNLTEYLYIVMPMRLG